MDAEDHVVTEGKTVCDVSDHNFDFGLEDNDSQQAGNLSALTKNSGLIASQSFIFTWKSKNANFCSMFSFFTLKYD